MPRTVGAKDKKPRKRRRKNPLISAAKGAALGSGVVGAGLLADRINKGKSALNYVGYGKRQLLEDSAKSLVKGKAGKARLAAIAAAGLLGGGAAYARRANKNIEQEEKDYYAMNLLNRYMYDRRRQRRQKLRDERRQSFDRRKKDVMDAVDKASRVSNNARSWVSAIGSGRRDWERIGIAKANLGLKRDELNVIREAAKRKKKKSPILE